MSIFRIVLVVAGLATVPAHAAKVDLTKLPLGDNKISTSAKRGYIWLCNKGPSAPPNQGTLPWVHGNTWNYKEKVSVAGDVSWPQAEFSSTIVDGVRMLRGNDLPVGHTTGVFPVQQSDPAFAYRPNPMSITAQNLSVDLPATPTVNAQPQCMRMEVGVTLDGVELFNGFDATYADAVAQEVQDKCDGHPNMSGYHRHWIPTCFKDKKGRQSKLMGYALDGFGIYGKYGADGKLMTNKDLDACHGTTSKVKFNGRKQRMYHYVATWEFPYTVGCFRGTPVGMGPGAFN